MDEIPKWVKRAMKNKKRFISFLIVIILLVVQYIYTNYNTATLEDLPEYDGKPSVVLDQNVPTFTEDDYKAAKKSYTHLSELDYLGRCGVAEMSVSKKDLPDDDRGDIAKVRPTGWRQAFYPELIKRNQGALYNRCHLLMYALSGLNDDERNLITGTGYLNIDGMLPYETAVLNYVEESHRVLYRVTPIYAGTNLVANGVHIEAGDVASQGSKFHINVYCYNVQPGIDISYKTGNSSANGNADKQDTIEMIEELIRYFTED